METAWDTWMKAGKACVLHGGKEYHSAACKFAFGTSNRTGRIESNSSCRERSRYEAFMEGVVLGCLTSERICNHG